jgi:hypothetical protein
VASNYHGRAHTLIEAALKLLATVPRFVWDHHSLPVPIEEIADSHLGLYVKNAEPQEMLRASGLEASSTPVQVSGLLLPDRREIWVNAEESRRWPLRHRYTVAHEIAHWSLHVDAVTSCIECRAEEVVHPAPDPTKGKEELQEMGATKSGRRTHSLGDFSSRRLSYGGCGTATSHAVRRSLSSFRYRKRP